MAKGWSDQQEFSKSSVLGFGVMWNLAYSASLNKQHLCISTIYATAATSSRPTLPPAQADKARHAGSQQGQYHHPSVWAPLRLQKDRPSAVIPVVLPPHALEILHTARQTLQIGCLPRELVQKPVALP